MARDYNSVSAARIVSPTSEYRDRARIASLRRLTKPSEVGRLYRAPDPKPSSSPRTTSRVDDILHQLRHPAGVTRNYRDPARSSSFTRRVQQAQRSANKSHIEGLSPHEPSKIHPEYLQRFGRMTISSPPLFENTTSSSISTNAGNMTNSSLLNQRTVSLREVSGTPQQNNDTLVFRNAQQGSGARDRLFEQIEKERKEKRSSEKKNAQW